MEVSPYKTQSRRNRSTETVLSNKHGGYDVFAYPPCSFLKAKCLFREVQIQALQGLSHCFRRGAGAPHTGGGLIGYQLSDGAVRHGGCCQRIHPGNQLLALCRTWITGSYGDHIAVFIGRGKSVLHGFVLLDLPVKGSPVHREAIGQGVILDLLA